MEITNPFTETPTTDVEDLKLVGLAGAGDRGALEELVCRHQAWVYNIVLRMVRHPQDAEDATQEILIKVITKLSTFRRASSFRTWLYRIAANHTLNMKRTRAEMQEVTFSAFSDRLDRFPDGAPPDKHLLVEEAKIGCTTAMLLCLDRRQRLAYVLGAIFGVSGAVAAEIMDVSPEYYRKILSRARRDMAAFMNGKCGLVNPANPCRCSKKTNAFIQAGHVDPDNLRFAREHLVRVREVAPRLLHEIELREGASEEVHRHNPFFPSSDLVSRIMSVLP